MARNTFNENGQPAFFIQRPSINEGTQFATQTVVNTSQALSNLSAQDKGSAKVAQALSQSLQESGHTNDTNRIVVTNVNDSAGRRLSLDEKVSTSGSSYKPSEARADPNKKSPTEKISDKKSDSYTESLAFPPDLKSNAKAYMRIEFYKFTDNFVDNALGRAIQDNSLVIYLPMPENFEQNFSVQYSPIDQSFFKAAYDGSEEVRTAIASFGNNTDTGAAMSNILQALVASGQRAISDDGFLEYVGRSLASAGENIFGGLVNRGSQQVANPHPSIFLKGVDLRSYSFTWKFVPKNSGESDAIHDIIKKIKNKTLPKKKDNFLTYPSLVKITILDDKGAPIQYGSDYKKAHVTTLNVNYTGEGTAAFFKDGRPVSINVDMGLSEIELYLEDKIGS